MTITQNQVAVSRLFAVGGSSPDEHVAAYGGLPELSPADLIAAVQDSGLAGRGGAGFPTGRKLAAVAQGKRPVVVGNGAEGEPASAKDRELLTRSPQLVFDGLALAARAVGAKTAILYAPGDLIDHHLRRLAADRRDTVPVTVHLAPDAFLSGEESAVISALEGGPAVPRTTPPRVFERGLNGRATLVQNVESLAQLALIARYGAEWFRRLGTPDEPGTRLVTVSGAVRRPGVFEVEGGSKIADILRLAGGASGVEALLVGGYHGAWIPWSAKADRQLRLSRADLAPYDASPGAGVIVALAGDRCGLRESARIVEYLAAQSAGQCGPCKFGMPTLSAALREVANGRPGPQMIAEVTRLSALMEHRGACHHPTGTVRFIRSAVRTFAADVALHRQGLCTRNTKRWSA